LLEKNKFFFGNYALLSNKSFFFEYVYLLKLILFLKFFKRLKYNYFKKFNIYINLFFNFPITQKSKNSRMGKGNGSVSRYVKFYKKNFLLLQILTINKYFYLNLLHFFKKKINPSFFIIKLKK
jgi:hypothetical protein